MTSIWMINISLRNLLHNIFRLTINLDITLSATSMNIYLSCQRDDIEFHKTIPHKQRLQICCHGVKARQIRGLVHTS